MRGGNNRLPDKVKAFQGTQQKCRTNPDAPKVEPTKVPAPPKSLTKEQREVWLELAPQVEALGTYSPSYYTAYRLMVQSVAEALHPDPRDPATARVRLAQVAAGHLQRFGLDPASSGRVATLKRDEGEENSDETPLYGIRGVVGGGGG